MKKKVIRLEEAHNEVLHGDAGVHRILIDENIAGAQNFAFLVNTTKAGLIEEPHTHEVE